MRINSQLLVSLTILVSLLTASTLFAEAQLERSKHYTEVKEPDAAVADSHYAVTSYLLAKAQFRDDDQRKAVEEGNRRAEEIILQRWADSKLKPFFFVNFSRQKNDLYILDKIRWNEPKGKRVADAIKVLDDPISVSPNVQTCYGFRWVSGLQKSGFAAFAASLKDLSRAKWVDDRRSSISRQLSAKLGSQHRQTMRQVGAFERYLATAEGEKKVKGAMQFFEYLDGAGSQFEGQLLGQLEAKRQSCAELVVSSTVERLQNLRVSSGSQLQKEIESLAESRRQWRSQALLAKLETKRAAELDRIALKLDAKTSELWAKEITDAAVNRRYAKARDVLKQRLSAVDDLAEQNREPATTALWTAYNKMLPEAAAHWQKLTAAEVEKGGRAGLSYLLAQKLEEVAGTHAELGKPPTDAAKAALATATALREKYGKLCDLRNQRQVIVSLPGGVWDDAAQATAKRLQSMLDGGKWVDGVTVVVAPEPGYLLDRDCLVMIEDGQLLVRADNEEKEFGKAVPGLLNPANDKVIAGLAGRYPLVLMEKAESGSSLGMTLHFWGLASRMLEKVDVKLHPDEEIREQLADVPALAKESIDIILSDWLGDQAN